MSIYPTPTNTNIFNEKDFNNNDKNENNDNDIIDLSNYVKKTGDTMNGKLLIPELEFYDSSIQNTAFDNTIKQNINNNTTKLSGINFINGYSEITKIKTNEIEINGINCDAFSNLDKLKIYENEGNILNHNNRITSNEINIATNASNIQTNITNIQTNTNKILTLENSIDDNGEQNISHSSNIGINGTNINTLSKSIHNNSIHIYKNVIKCNDLLNRTSIISTDVLNNTNEIQQTKTDLLNVNNEINDNKIKTLENEQQININTTNITNIMPVGTILITAIPPTEAPSVGYLYCDGASVSISTYGNLYAILGNTYKYNKQEYSGYFYLPDMRQLFVRGSQQNETYPVNAQSVPMGTYQGQSIQTHSHNFEKSGNESAGSGGLGTITVGSNSYTATKTSNMFDSANNQIYQSVAETRPESISMNYMIKY